MEIAVRPALTGDAAAMCAVLNPIIQTRAHSAYVEPHSPERMAAALAGDRVVAHVAEDDATGEVVGYQRASPLAPEARSFDHVATMETFVRLGHHKQGIAARLFAATFEAAKAAGYEKICTFVRADNEAGLRAYLGQGFVEVGRNAKQAKIDDRYVDEVIIERFL
jgi:L-amino acid N-acyltransferase YncA